MARCVAIGVFDGVHLGHRAMLQQACAAAELHEPRLPVRALTFHPHPQAVLGQAPGLLCELDERRRLLHEVGADEVEVLAFTRELAATSAESFVADMLVAEHGAQVVVVGANFRFGQRAAGDVRLLRELGHQHGFDVIVVELAGDGAGAISSSRIRALLVDGEVAAAMELLGRPYALAGMVVRGARRGRELGMPTANLEPLPHRVVPGDGVYAGRATIADGREFTAAISVGTNPQFDVEGTAPRTVEAYLLGYDEVDGLYDQAIEIRFHARVRGQAVFASVDELCAQMQRDVVAVRDTIESPTHTG